MDLFPPELWNVIKDIGAAGLGVIALWLFYKIFTLFIDQWGKSTEAINRNTETHNEMKDMLHRSHERELEFQRDVIVLLKDTHKKVNAVHEKITDGDD